MTKQDKDRWKAYQQLQDHDIDVQKTSQIRFNSGSETFVHACVKLAAGFILQQRGYRVSSEVEMLHGEADIVAYGLAGYPDIVVECETSPTEQVKHDKIGRYVDSNPVIDDMILLNVSEAPTDIMEILAWVQDQL